MNDELRVTHDEWLKIKSMIFLSITSIIGGSILTYFGFTFQFYGLLFFSISSIVIGMSILILILFSLEHEEIPQQMFTKGITE